MKISNIFYSIQGEGKNIGLPSVFVRLSGCNLSCHFCDTKYSWKDGEEQTVLDVLLKIVSYGCNNIVISGGEPLLQQDELIELMEKLLGTNLFYNFEIETNGTIPPKKRLAELTDLFTVSPKFIGFKYAPVFSNIESLAERPNVVFKFVVEENNDIKNILQFIKEYNHKGLEVFLMPCCTTVEEHNSRLKIVIKLAKKYGFRITPRLHILAYGNKRGV